MTTEIKTPNFPESIADGTVAAWHKLVGEPVRRDEVLVDIETDKVVIEVPAPANGQLVEILKQEGEVVLSNEPLATFEEGAVASAPTSSPSAPEAEEAEVGMSPAARKLAAEAGIDPARGGRHRPGRSGHQGRRPARHRTRSRGRGKCGTGTDGNAGGRSGERGG